MIKSWLRKEISNKFPDIEFDILTPPDSKMGDYSINLSFVVAKSNKTSPMEAGKDIVNNFCGDNNFSKRFQKIELISPGFINFHLNSEFLKEQLLKINKNKRYGSSEEGRGERVIVEYGGVNIAKPMHVGHLRSTIIGDALANIYEYLGYKVIRWNYIGDWGTQFGKLIAAHKRWVDESLYQRDPIAEMLRLYVKFHDELKNNQKLGKEGQEEFLKLEEGDAENRKIWKEFSGKSLQEFSHLFKELNVALWQKRTVVKGESSYEGKLKLLIRNLKDQGFIKKSDGALIFPLGNIPPAMMQKSDGATLYITRDLASLQDRVYNYHASKVLYVVSNQQALHFEQLFAVAKKIGLRKTYLVHVKFGMVLGGDGKKFATREGKVVALQEVIDKIVSLATKEARERNLDSKMEKVQKIGKAIGIGALKYNDLKQHPYSDIVFDWDAMLDLRGNSGPYLQYTYARLRHIMKNSRWCQLHIGKLSFNVSNSVGRLFVKVDTAKLTGKGGELKIIKKLLDFPEVVSKCAELNTLNGLALYLYELSSMANYFYETVEKLSDYTKHPERNARLLLVETIVSVLKKSLNLLGIEALERV